MPESLFGDDNRKRNEQARERILRAAEAVFLRNGVDATRMEEIARECGLSVGGLYWHYEGKRALILDTLRRLFEPDLAALRELARLPGTPRERIERCFLRTVTDDRRVRPFVQEVYSLGHRDDEIAAVLASYVESYKTLYEDILSDAADAGDVPADTVDVAATALLAIYEGSIELSFLSGSDDDPTLAVLEAMRLLLSGILKAD